MINRKARIAGAFFVSLAVAPASADDFPNRPVKLIQPSTAGGFSDTLSRIIANGLSPRLGQSVVVENRTGAMNMLANKMVSRADPDGYTMLWGTIDMTMVPALRKDAATFDSVRDLTPVAMVANIAGVYVVNPSLPVHDIGELAAYAKANPGKVRNAHIGYGGSLHLTAKLFEMKTGTELAHIPYRGTSEAMVAVLSGQVDMSTFSISTAAVNREKVRILAQTGRTRHPILREVPTVAESGMPDLGIIYWFGIFVPPNTPKPIVDRLARDLRATLEEPALQEKFFAMGAAVDYMPPESFTPYVAGEIRKWSQLIPAMGFVPE